MTGGESSEAELRKAAGHQNQPEPHSCSFGVISIEPCGLPCIRKHHEASRFQPSNPMSIRMLRLMSLNPKQIQPCRKVAVHLTRCLQDVYIDRLRYATKCVNDNWPLSPGSHLDQPKFDMHESVCLEVCAHAKKCIQFRAAPFTLDAQCRPRRASRDTYHCSKFRHGGAICSCRDDLAPPSLRMCAYATLKP